MIKSPLSLHKFYFDSIQREPRRACECYGQVMFNHLLKVRPLLAEAVRGTDKDPTQVEQFSHPIWDRFVDFIETYWNDQLFLEGLDGAL